MTLTPFNEGLLIGLIAGNLSAGFIVYMACREAVKRAHQRAIEETLANLKEAHPRAVKRVLEKMSKP